MAVIDPLASAHLLHVPPPVRDVGSGHTVADVLSGLATQAISPRAQAFPTGFDLLDTVLDGGLRAHDLVLVGGLPGVGKTVATLQWARNMARDGASVIYACYEHDERSLVTRLLMLEVGELGRPEDVASSETIRALVQGFCSGRITLGEALDSYPGLALAHDRIREYAPRLRLIRASGAHTGVEELASLVAAHGVDRTVLFVDYLQKVAIPAAVDGSDRVLHITEGLKELAIDLDVAVVAVVAADTHGLQGGRLRLHHLRGAAALAYEADVAILLNDKVHAVSKVHLAYDTVRAAGFKHQVVCTVEKNRGGPAPIDLEFNKDFARFRFDPRGAFVSERLVDERLEEA